LLIWTQAIGSAPELSTRLRQTAKPSGLGIPRRGALAERGLPNSDQASTLGRLGRRRLVTEPAEVGDLADREAAAEADDQGGRADRHQGRLQPGRDAGLESRPAGRLGLVAAFRRRLVRRHPLPPQL
jgi:hypothetical protein